MNDRHKQLMAAVTTTDDELALALAGEVKWLAHVDDNELHQLLAGFVHAADSGRVLNEKLLGAMLRQVVLRSHLAVNGAWNQLSDNAREATVALYQRLGSASPSRHSLLQLLAVSR